jgi:Flp pilus assembly protein TadD
MFRLDSDAQPSREDRQRWMVRDPADGDILYFNTFDTLHRWIVEREVDRTWEISRTGDKWMPLGDIGEFRPIFQVVDNVSSIESGEAPAAGRPDSAERKPEPTGRSSKDTLDQFSTQGTSPTTSQTGGTSAPDEETQVTTGNPANRRERSPSDQPGSQTGSRSESPHRVSAQSGETKRTHRPSPSSQSAQSAQSGEHRQRTPSPGPATGGAGDASASSNVQFESDRFGDEPTDPSCETSAGDSPAEDEWTFGDEVGHDQTTTIEGEAGVDYYSESRSWPTIVGVLMVLVAGSAGYLWFFERDRLDQWLASGEASGDTVDIGGEVDEPKVPEHLQTGKTSLGEALQAARDEARTEGQSLVEAAVEEARPTVGDGVSAAGQQAQQKAEASQRRSVFSLLQDANRALEEGNASRAQRLFSRVVQRDSTNSEAITGLGWALLNRGQTDRAISQFEKALQYNPSYGDAYIGLGQANKSAGRPREALDAYNTYLQKVPGGSKSSIAEYQQKQLQQELGIN